MARRDTPSKRLKYRTLSYLPGRWGLHYARKLRRLDASKSEAALIAALEETRGTICLDLGANVGKYATLMARTASKVYAFEPDPWTVERLRDAVADQPNIEVIQAAAGAVAGEVTLYRRKGFADDPAGNSEGASILSEKRNVDDRNAVKVPLIDVVAFLEGLAAPVGVMKIDIEGAEVDLLERLLDHPIAARVSYIFCETHEDRIPELAPRTQALRAKAAGMTAPRVDLGWE